MQLQVETKPLSTCIFPTCPFLNTWVILFPSLPSFTNSFYLLLVFVIILFTPFFLIHISFSFGFLHLLHSSPHSLIFLLPMKYKRIIFSPLSPPTLPLPPHTSKPANLPAHLPAYLPGFLLPFLSLTYLTKRPPNPRPIQPTCLLPVCGGQLHPKISGPVN